MENEQKPKINTQILGMTEDELPRVSLKGSEVVRRQYLSHIREAILTVRPDGVMFNNSCIAMMEDVVYIQFLVNRQEHRIIIRASVENDRDSQRWCNEKDGKRKSRKITGREFSIRVYRMMGWSRGYYYKICGTPALQVDKEDELLLVFDLDECERYTMTAKGRKAAGVTDEELGEELQKIQEEESRKEAETVTSDESTPKKSKRKGRFPDSWDSDSFGVPVEEHENRVEVDRLQQITLNDFLEGDFSE
ncbi:MAG: hypothetical protein LUG91_05145 [Ruminococcus sp.]|nr:hypothetical protein [Ruminococcus sp.]